MRVRKLIEILAKCDWNSEVRIDSRKDVAPRDICDPKASEKLRSISGFVFGGKKYTTLNVRDI